MPPGMCMCGDCGSECESREGDVADAGSTAGFGRATIHCHLCNCSHDESDCQHCPPSCPCHVKNVPAKKAEHVAVSASATAIVLPALDVEAPSVYGVSRADSPLQPSAEPIYIRLCALLI